MSTCRTCSEVGFRIQDSGFGGIVLGSRVLLVLLALSFGGAAAPAGAPAQELLTQAEALQLAFPGATAIERHTAFLDERQLAAAQTAAGRNVAVEQPVVTYYVGMSGTRPLGVAYFDAHSVRTLREVVMIVVTPRATVDRIEILSFAEPPEYRAPEGWLDQFDGKPLSADLALRRQIRNISGATLTSRAITEAVRRTLAIHRVIAPFSDRQAHSP